MSVTYDRNVHSELVWQTLKDFILSDHTFMSHFQKTLFYLKVCFKSLRHKRLNKSKTELNTEKGDNSRLFISQI